MGRDRPPSQPPRAPADPSTGPTPSSGEYIPAHLSAETQAYLTIQVMMAKATEQQAHTIQDFQDKLTSIEAIVRPLAVAEADRIAARARLAQVVSDLARHFVESTASVGKALADAFVGIFASHVTRLVGAVGFVLLVLSLAGVQMTVLDVNRALETMFAPCPEGLSPASTAHTLSGDDDDRFIIAAPPSGPGDDTVEAEARWLDHLGE